MTVDLGPSCVFDAHRVQVGMYLEVEKRTFVVTGIEGEKVTLRPVLGTELWRYRINKLARMHKVRVCLVVALLVGTLIVIAAQVYTERFLGQ